MYCTIELKKTVMNWECDTTWELEVAVTPEQWKTDTLCITGDAILKNFASKAMVDEHRKMMEKEVAERKDTATPVTMEQLEAEMAKMKKYFCRNKANCNLSNTPDTVCTDANTIKYDAAKDTTYWKDSAAIFLSASAALTAAFSLI